MEGVAGLPPHLSSGGTSWPWPLTGPTHNRSSWAAALGLRLKSSSTADPGAPAQDLGGCTPEAGRAARVDASRPFTFGSLLPLCCVWSLPRRVSLRGWTSVLTADPAQPDREGSDSRHHPRLAVCRWPGHLPFLCLRFSNVEFDCSSGEPAEHRWREVLPRRWVNTSCLRPADPTCRFAHSRDFPPDPAELLGGERSHSW